MLYHTRNSCRSCKHEDLQLIVDFGELPISDALLQESQLNDPELVIPVTLVVCPNCSLVQVQQDVNPEVLFCNDYPYYSSISPSLMAHFEASAVSIIKKYNLSDLNFVVEAASNDGYMLQHFLYQGISVLGVEPAEGQAKVAVSKGIDAINTFFSNAVAEMIVDKWERKADIFLANNVLAHVPDPVDFAKGIATVLDQDGTAILEMSYLPRLIEVGGFDNVFHQHYSYYSLHALVLLFKKAGLIINDAEEIKIHGGSIRIFVSRKPEQSENLLNLIEIESKLGIKDFAYYQNFAKRIHTLKNKITILLSALKTEGKSIVAYGAAGKANTFLNYFQIDSKFLEYIADLSPYKQGFYFCGNHLPIVPPEKLEEDQPDYVLITAWNFAEEIMKQLDDYHKKGGKFIVPIPELKII